MPKNDVHHVTINGTPNCAKGTGFFDLYGPTKPKTVRQKWLRATMCSFRSKDAACKAADLLRSKLPSHMVVAVVPGECPIYERDKDMELAWDPD